MGIVGRPVHFIVGEAPVGPPIGGGGIISPYLVYDTFTDTAGTVLNLHTPDVDVVGGGWNRDLNTMIINASNQVEEDINSSVSISTIDAGESDVVSQILITSGH
jgi:hypothetical protein